MSQALVTVVIPTLCATKRAMELQRAIASVNAQEDVAVQTLVVVNGQWFEQELLAKVKSTPGVTVLMLAMPGISTARLHGRQHVQTPYFLFLDDDDELYPSALREMLATFQASDRDTGLVVADAYNDYRCSNYGFVPSSQHIERDPMGALLEQNWLIAQAALFKTALAPMHLFDIRTDSNECTMIAFNLALENIKVRVNEKVLALIHDNMDSESKTEHFIVQETKVIRWMLRHHVPSATRARLRRKLAAAFHNNSVYYLQRRMFWKSLVAHLKSMLVPGGDSYALYGRHIVLGLVRGHR